MTDHKLFGYPVRASQSLCNDRCQNILYKAVFEHFKELHHIAALLLTSKSFQNSSFGANFLVNFVVEKTSILLLESVLSPSSCMSMQFVPSLQIQQSRDDAAKIKRGIAHFVGEMVNTKYLSLSLQSLSMDSVTNEVLSSFLGSSVNEWPRLLHLSLEKCDVNEGVLETISQLMVHLRTVNLSGNSRIGAVGLRYLAKLGGITSLDMSSCAFVTDTGLEPISKLANMTSLNLSCCNLITDAGLEHISKLTGITSLALSFCADTGLEHIAKLSGITTLHLSWCNNVTDAGLEHISKLCNITSLSLFGCNLITAAGVQHFSTLSGMNSLDLSFCSTITDTVLEHIAKLSNVTSLSLANCVNITDAGLEQIAKLSNIKTLNMRGCNNITNAGLEHVSTLSRIISLDISFCGKLTSVAKKNLKAALPNLQVTE